MLIDPYAKAVMGRRKFGELGPVRERLRPIPKSMLRQCKLQPPVHAGYGAAYAGLLRGGTPIC